MDLLKDISYDECVTLLGEETVGRVALCLPDGPHIVPVNYVVDGEAIIFRTAPYSVLGTHANGAKVAFEVDRLDHERSLGWSVVAVGRCGLVESAVDVSRYRATDGPRPWAAGSRLMHLRLPWSTLSGRRAGNWAAVQQDA